MKDVPCFIIGNAPSLKYINLTPLNNYFSVGINKIYLIYEPTILLWQDLTIWKEGKNKIIRCNSIKYCRKYSETNGNFYNFRLNDNTNRKMSNSTTILNGRGVTAKITFQFVCALGCNPIIFIGTDGTYDKNGDTDFYGKNKWHKNRNNLKRFSDALKYVMRNKRNKTIINCCSNPILGKTYSLKKAIKLINGKKYSKIELEERLLFGKGI